MVNQIILFAWVKTINQTSVCVLFHIKLDRQHGINQGFVIRSGTHPKSRCTGRHFYCIAEHFNVLILKSDASKETLVHHSTLKWSIKSLILSHRTEQDVLQFYQCFNVTLVRVQILYLVIFLLQLLRITAFDSPQLSDIAKNLKDIIHSLKSDRVTQKTIIYDLLFFRQFFW